MLSVLKTDAQRVMAVKEREEVLYQGGAINVEEPCRQAGSSHFNTTAHPPSQPPWHRLLIKLSLDGKTFESTPLGCTQNFNLTATGDFRASKQSVSPPQSGRLDSG